MLLTTRTKGMRNGQMTMKVAIIGRERKRGEEERCVAYERRPLVQSRAIKKKKKTEQQQYFLLSVETVAKIVKFPNSHSSTKLSLLHC